MKVFVSYSKLDGVAVQSLVDDLKSAGQKVWVDKNLVGGVAWWAEILEQIRDCELFVCATSDNSLNSKPCQAERSYATALGISVLPVQIADVLSYRIDAVFSLQSVDYREMSSDRSAALWSALNSQTGERTALPESLPEPPPIPYEYLMTMSAAIRDKPALSPSEQASMVFDPVLVRWPAAGHVPARLQRRRVGESRFSGAPDGCNTHHLTSTNPRADHYQWSGRRESNPRS